MSIWSKIFTPVPPSTKDNEDFFESVFSFLGDFINRKELASQCFSLAEKIKDLSGKEKERAAVKAYFCFEHFITENKPLIVKKTTKKGELRDEISKKFGNFEEYPLLNIIFLDEIRQKIGIFLFSTDELIKYSLESFGVQKVREIFGKSLSKRDLDKILIVGDREIYLKKDADFSILNIEELDYDIRNFLDLLIKELKNRFGERVPEEILNRRYSEMIGVFDFDIISYFLKILPEGVLEKEKVGLLARDELEKKLASSIVEEKKKRETMESMAMELQKLVEELNASKAATLNLLEDINTEKGAVEKEVEKRTRQLREETALIRSTVESLPLAFFSVSKELKIIEKNNLFLKIFSLDKLISIEEIDKNAQSFVFKDNCLKVFKDKKTLIFEEIRIIGRLYKIYLVPVLEGDEAISVLCLLEDITEQKIVERSKEEFFSIASHELRTPLTAIRGNASMILEFFLSSLPNKDVEQMVRDIHESSIRLIKIVSDFLDVSRLEQGKIIFKKEPVDLGDIAKDTVREFLSTAILKTISLEIGNIDNANLKIIADKDRIKQIVSNLVSNAINYTNKGRIVLSVRNENNIASIYVEDTGVGIAEENKVLLFRKFQQAQEKILTRDASRSTGLGLYISKLLADSMGGNLELVKSEFGKGSTFRFSMPIKI